MSEHPPADLPDPPGAAAAVLDEDRACIHCSYNLRGLPASGRCPECGTPVADSLRGFLLQYAGEPFLQNLRSGLSLVLNGILLSVAMIFLAIPAAFIGGTAESLLTIIVLVPTALIFWGYWKYTEPDPGYVGHEPPRSARQVARVAVAVQAAVQVWTALVDFGAVPGSAPGSGPFELLRGLTYLVGLAAWAVQFFAIMAYTRWLATRVPDRFVIRRSTVYRWLLPLLTTVGALAVGLGPLIALVLYWNLLDRMRKHLKAILASGWPAELPKRLG